MKHIPPDALCRADTHASIAPAFREELESCIPVLRRYARKLGGADLGEDFLQETLSRALACETAYRTEGAMLAWLRQILKNIARDQHKKRQRYELFCDLAPDIEGDESGGDAGDFASTVPDDTTLGARETQLDAKKFIELAAKVIGSETWRCLELTARGFSSEEIASQLGISRSAVRQNVSRGRKAMEALRAALQQKASKPSRKKPR